MFEQTVNYGNGDGNYEKDSPGVVELNEIKKKKHTKKVQKQSLARRDDKEITLNIRCFVDAFVSINRAIVGEVILAEHGEWITGFMRHIGERESTKAELWQYFGV